MAKKYVVVEDQKKIDKGWSNKVRSHERKEAFLEMLKKGYTVKDACRLVDWKSESTYKYHRGQDPDFRFEADKILQRRGVKARADREEREFPDFPEFSEKYLKQRLFNHQLQWYDLLEGRDPRGLHPSQRYDKGDKNRVIINTPPEHSKSTTITMNYVTWRICKDPSVRVLVVSKTQGMAKKFLSGIKMRLTSRRYADLIRDFAPGEGGFDGGNAIWRQDMIYVNQEELEDGVAEKDPTVEALGIGGQIYGARADIIIVDDGVTLDNVGGFENQIDWMQQEVESRLGAFGRIVVVGTRVAPMDLYVELANPKRYPTGESPWTYLTQPAVLDMAEDPKDWVTLWPKSNMPMVGDPAPPDESGLYDYWTGPRMLKVRNTKQPRTWAMVYMQQQVDEQAVFPATDVMGCVDGMRSPGRLHPDREGGQPVDKGQDWYLIAGMDPATVEGFTAITVYGFNRRTQKRRIVDVVNRRLTPDAMVNTMKEVTIRYGVDEWRVEKNAFQAFLTQTKEIVNFMASRGVLLREHTTGNNKHDADFGVSAMAMLFRNHQDGNAMISLPAKTNEGIRALIEQLIVWAPQLPKTQKTDAVMSLWFAELRARELVQMVGTDEYASGEDQWLSENDSNERVVLSIDEFLAAQREQRLVGF